MSNEENPIEIQENNLSDVDEKTQIQQRLDQMGISYKKTHGVDKLKEFLKLALIPDDNAKEEFEKENKPKIVPEYILRQELIKKASKLTRVIVNTLDPNENSLRGQFFTFVNGKIGTIKRFVPFGEYCGEKGTHVEESILNIIRSKKYMKIVKYKDSKGIERYKKVASPKYAVQETGKITQKELDEIKARQAANSTFSANDKEKSLI